MQIFNFLIVMALSILNANHSFAQVNLPIDASNCAILNALKPDNKTSCMGTHHLGTSRGLIVNLDSTAELPDAQQKIVQLPKIQITAPQKSVVKTPKIDRKAAKSENGYYIHFAFDSEVLTKEYQDHLKRLTVVLNSPSMKDNCIKITGHTDTVGSDQYNLGLSKKRAQSVYTYLVSLNSVDKKRLSILGAGEAYPLPDKKGESPFNRRVEFSSKIVENGCQSKS